VIVQCGETLERLGGDFEANGGSMVCRNTIDVSIDRWVEQRIGSDVLINASIERMQRADVKMKPSFEEIEGQDVPMIQGVVRSFRGLVERKRSPVKTVGAAEPFYASSERDEPSLERVGRVPARLFEGVELLFGLFVRLKQSSQPDIGGSVRNIASSERMWRQFELTSGESVVHEPDDDGLVVVSHLTEPRELGIGPGLAGLAGADRTLRHREEGDGVEPGLAHIVSVGSSVRKRASAA
jgi:hypothetical protein